MPYMPWDESYRVGVEEIDAQHRRLFEMVNALHDACGPECDPALVMRAARELTEYTRHHFATEEKYMDEYQYAGRDAHLEEHMRCSMRAVDFFAQGVAGDPDTAGEMLTFLRGWLLDHVRGTDRGLGAFLSRRGQG